MTRAKGVLKEVLVLRLGPGEDIIGSLEQTCREENIRSGAILSINGSMDGAQFFTVQERPDLKAGFGYSEPVVLDGAVEMLAACGTISHLGDAVNVHIHCSIGDRQGIAHGGHLIPGNKVLLTMEIVIGVFEHVDMAMKLCPTLEVNVLAPTAC